MTWAECDQAVDRACAEFPNNFGLRGFPGETFRVSRAASFWSNGVVQLYTQRLVGDRWLDFAKGTPTELAANIVPNTSIFR